SAAASGWRKARRGAPPSACSFRLKRRARNETSSTSEPRRSPSHLPLPGTFRRAWHQSKAWAANGAANEARRMEYVGEEVEEERELHNGHASAPLANGRRARPTRAQAEEAVRTLILWAGDDPRREGLAGTPERVVRAYEGFFCGYRQNPVEPLRRTFEEIEGYDEMIVLRDIRFESHCEHHMAPIIGVAHVGYLPDRRVVGISKLARVVDAYAKRFQIQERMTAQIANTIEEVLRPKGVGVVIEATHECMTTRG